MTHANRKLNEIEEMYIKQLEIDNFKSFANKIEIPLLKGFTTISGPIRLHDKYWWVAIF